MALKVNGRYIDDAVLLAEEARIRAALQDAMKGKPAAVIEARVVEWARENVIERVLLEEAALKEDEGIEPELLEAAVAERKAVRPGCILPGFPFSSEEDIRREVELELRTQQLIRTITEDLPPPGQDEVAAFYTENREQFTAPEMVHAAHIVKNVDEKTSERKAYGLIEEIAAKLGNGARFEELADQFSDCPGRGGDLGLVARGQMVEAFERVVFALAPGEISRSFRSVFGFHIAKVYEKRDRALRPLSEVQGKIEEYLHEQRRRHELEEFLDALRAGARVVDAAGRAF
jgi:hypothetical protein